MGTAESAKHVLLIYRRMIPSIRLCGHCQMEEMAQEGKISYRAIQGMRLKRSDLEWAQIVLLGRLDSWYELQIVRRLSKAGKYLIYMMDDDLLNVPAEVTSSSYYNQKEIRQCIREIINLSDAVLSPSPLLLEKYARDGRKGILIEEPAIRPIPFQPHDPEKPVKIGFAGSTDRMGDLENILREVLPAIRKEYGARAAFEFFGAKPSFAEALGAKCIPYTEDYDQFRDTLNRLEWDIGLAPMPESPFHACKHYNKFVEYAATGIVGIYSDVAPYDRLSKFPGCAVLCRNTTEEWSRVIRSLMDDNNRREDMRRKAAECALGVLSVGSCAETMKKEMDACFVHKEGAEKRRSGNFFFLKPSIF